MINKVKPINNTLDYWHKYRPWAHQCLNNYTYDEELHGNLDSELWFLLKRILSNVKDYNKLTSYIKTSIRGIVKCIKNRLSYKYTLVDDDTLDKSGTTELNITLDEYLERRALIKYIDRLPDKEQEVLKRYFGIPPFNKESLVNISKEMKTFQQRIYYIKERGLRRLKDIMNLNGIYNTKEFIYGKE